MLAGHATRSRWCGLNKPVFEAGVEGEGVRAGQEYALLQEGAIVASLGVGNDLSRVSSKAQALADQLIETELLWSGDLDGDQANHVGGVGAEAVMSWPP
jgi:hypothetical protein